MTSPEFLVDIPMCAYNHEKFISQAIEGVINQKTSFKYRLFIGEDCSTDNTKEIILRYQSEYPDKIFPFFREKNLGAHENSELLFKACTSKYIALCDGDDFWVDPNKLQKQIDILEENINYAGCSSNVFEKNGDELKPVFGKKNEISFDDFMKGNSIHTCSVVYRNIIKIPEWYSQCKMGDWILWLLLTKVGPIYNVDELMSVYRMHNDGVWISRGKENNLKDIINTYTVLINNFPEKDKSLLRLGAKQYYIHLLNLLISKRSEGIFYWTYKAFKFDFDLKWFKFLIRYFINSLKFRTNAVKG